MMQDEQGPKRLASVLLSSLMLAVEGAEDLAIEQAIPQPRAGERSFERLFERAAQPARERYAEALLRPIDDLVGQVSARRLLQEIFARPTSDFMVRRKRERPIDHLVVEHRRPHLEAVSHRGAIDLGQ